MLCSKGIIQHNNTVGGISRCTIPYESEGWENVLPCAISPIVNITLKTCAHEHYCTIPVSCDHDLGGREKFGLFPLFVMGNYLGN